MESNEGLSTLIGTLSEGRRVPLLATYAALM